MGGLNSLRMSEQVAGKKTITLDASAAELYLELRSIF